MASSPLLSSQIIKLTTHKFQFFGNEMINTQSILHVRNIQLGLNDGDNGIPSFNALVSSSSINEGIKFIIKLT